MIFLGALLLSLFGVARSESYPCDSRTVLMSSGNCLLGCTNCKWREGLLLGAER